MSDLGKNVSKQHVYRKVSTLKVPFWGITKNRLEQLDADDLDYSVQFDYPDGSIVLTSEQVKDMISGKKVADDGDYKISLNDIEKVLPI